MEYVYLFVVDLFEFYLFRSPIPFISSYSPSSFRCLRMPHHLYKMYCCLADTQVETPVRFTGYYHAKSNFILFISISTVYLVVLPEPTPIMRSATTSAAFNGDARLHLDRMVPLLVFVASIS